MVDPSRRSASSASATGSGAEDHPRSPTVRRVVDRAMPADAPVAQVVDPDRGKTLLLDPAGDARGERPFEHRREERQDVDLEGHASGSAGRRADRAPRPPGRVPRPLCRRPGPVRRPMPRATSAPATGCLGTIRIRRARPGRTQIERRGVDHDLAAARSEDPDERADGRQVEAPIGAAVDGEHLGLADPVDVLDRAELLAIDAANGTADDLVPVVRPAGQVLVRPDDQFEIGATKRVGGVARGHLAEAQPPARAIRDGLRRRDRQRAAIAFPDRARRRRRSGPRAGRSGPPPGPRR